MRRTTGTAHGLYLVRTVRLARADAYRAWTEPRELRRWFGPERGYTLDEVEIDARAGGRFRLVMRPPDEPPYAVRGTFEDVKPEHWMLFTWEWEGDRGWSRSAGKPLVATTVTVQLRDRDAGSTEILLAHEGFRDDREREDHRWGWSGALDRLCNEY